MTSVLQDVRAVMPPAAKRWLADNVDDIIKQPHGEYGVSGKFQYCVVDTRNFLTINVRSSEYRDGNFTPVYEKLGRGDKLYANNVSDWVQGVGSIMQYYVDDYRRIVGIKNDMDNLISKASRVKLNMDINAHNYALDNLKGIENCIAVIRGETEKIEGLI